MPSPIVLFKQFGATPWISSCTSGCDLNDDMQTAVVQSEVRERINELFQQNNAQPIIAAAPFSGDATSAATRPAKAA